MTLKMTKKYECAQSAGQRTSLPNTVQAFQTCSGIPSHRRDSTARASSAVHSTASPASRRRSFRPPTRGTRSPSKGLAAPVEQPARCMLNARSEGVTNTSAEPNPGRNEELPKFEGTRQASLLSSILRNHTGRDRTCVTNESPTGER